MYSTQHCILSSKCDLIENNILLICIITMLNVNDFTTIQSKVKKKVKKINIFLAVARCKENFFR